MTAEGRRSPPSPEELLSPNNFLGYLGASVHLYRVALRKVAVPFVLLGALVAVGSSAAAVAADSGSTTLTLVVLYIQLLSLPLLGSLLSARTSLVIARSFAGIPTSLREAGALLRGGGSHVLLAAMVAALITLLMTLTFQLLGAFVAAHLLLGPPVFMHVLVIEKRPLQDAWARTRSLARGQALRIFLYLLCAALLFVMLEVVISGLIYSLLLSATGEELALVINTPIAGAISGLGLSIMSAVNLVAYFDMRTRTEDFGLEQLRADLDDSDDRPALEEADADEGEPDES